MKNLIVVVSLLIISFSVNSQNWSPVSYGNKYHYTCDTTQTIFTLFADSFDVQGNDTLFYMNRIVLPCDTCVDLSGYESIGITERAYLRNQPQFLMRSCLVSDSSIWLNSPKSYALYPQLPIGSNWIFDTINNITAHLEAKESGFVLGESDSICLILMTTGDSIILSKNHGIVKYPVITGGYFRLYGIEGNINAGERLAGFMDFFNFNVGDSFVYYVSSYNPENYGPPERWYYSITSKTVYPVGYVYEISGAHCEPGWLSCNNYSPFSGYLCFNNNCASYPQAFGYYIETYEYSFFNSYSYNLIFLYDNGPDQNVYQYCKRTKSSGIDYFELDPRLLFTIFPESIPYNADILVSEDIPCQGNEYARFLNAGSGIGVKLKEECLFEYNYYLELLFCMINGDTIVNQLVSSDNNITTVIGPKIFPNPANNKITLTNSILFKTASIYSTSGKKVKEITLNGEKTEVDISDLIPGLYFVILEGKNKRATLKFVVEK